MIKRRIMLSIGALIMFFALLGPNQSSVGSIPYFACDCYFIDSVFGSYPGPTGYNCYYWDGENLNYLGPTTECTVLGGDEYCYYWNCDTEGCPLQCIEGNPE